MDKNEFENKLNEKLKTINSVALNIYDESGIIFKHSPMVYLRNNKNGQCIGIDFDKFNNECLEEVFQRYKNYRELQGI
jgi:hypothetical protein